ncbi:MAG: septum formation protein Maf [Clostridia bacterium]|nr:septum formation protein Maf [Clostridia bacterium]
MKLILASQSPRRHDILHWMGVSFETEVCTEPEVVSADLPPKELVRALALQKATFAQNLHPDEAVLGADTIVVLDDEVLGKPSSAAQAKEYLSRLQGRQHTVYTGVALLCRDRRDVRCCETEVTFRPMSEAEIDWYVSTQEPMDKAGAYGLQGLGCVFVERLNGNYFNVIGLPAPTVYEMLLSCGYFDENRTVCL